MPVTHKAGPSRAASTQAYTPPPRASLGDTHTSDRSIAVVCGSGQVALSLHGVTKRFRRGRQAISVDEEVHGARCTLCSANLHLDGRGPSILREKQRAASSRAARRPMDTMWQPKRPDPALHIHKSRRRTRALPSIDSDTGTGPVLSGASQTTLSEDESRASAMTAPKRHRTAPPRRSPVTTTRRFAGPRVGSRP